jgi:hypothetical protein
MTATTQQAASPQTSGASRWPACSQATAAGEYGASFNVSHPNYVSAASNAATLSITKRTQTIVPAIVKSENLRR